MGMLFLLVVVVSLAPQDLFAQKAKKEKRQREKPEITKRVYFGGYLGMQFGTVTDIILSPMVGYRFTPRLNAGVGFTYEYYQDNTWTPKYSTSLYGPRVFARYLLIASFSNVLPVDYNGGIFLHTEYETLNMDRNYFGNVNPVPGEGGRFWMHSWLVGGGLRQPISRTASVNFLLLFYIGDDSYTPYSNPLFRIEFSF